MAMAVPRQAPYARRVGRRRTILGTRVPIAAVQVLSLTRFVCASIRQTRCVGI